MNRPEGPNDEERRLIDRLVDGELDPDTRRALLARFEDEPDGWRRCALAFLENQGWREALAPRPGDFASTSTPPVASRSAPGSRGARRWGPMAAVAAGWVAAFAAGWAAGGGPGASRPREAPVASRKVTTPEPVPTVARPERPAIPPTPGRSVAIVEVPVFGAGPFAQPSAPLPESIRKELERRGFQVEPRRGLVSVKLKDGRHVAVPVEALKVRYVGDRTL
jgi:hypothetical protein